MVWKYNIGITGIFKIFPKYSSNFIVNYIINQSSVK